MGRPQQTAFGIALYPTLPMKAAALMHSIAENQPFVDGNKRIAWISARVFLRINGLTLKATDGDAYDLLVRRIPSGISIVEVASWIESHAAATDAEPGDG